MAFPAALASGWPPNVASAAAAEAVVQAGSLRPQSAAVVKTRLRPVSGEKVPSLASVRQKVADGGSDGLAAPFAAAVAARSSTAPVPQARVAPMDNAGLSLNELRQIVQGRQQVPSMAPSAAVVAAAETSPKNSATNARSPSPQQMSPSKFAPRPATAGAFRSQAGQARSGSAMRRVQSDAVSTKTRSQTWAHNHGGENPSGVTTAEDRGRAATTGTMSPSGKKKGNAASKRPASVGQKKKPKENRNPFVEYEDREMRLTQERKLLQEDAAYMFKRKEDLRRGALMKDIANRDTSADDLYEKRTFFGSYSVQLRANKAGKPGRSSSAVEKTRNASPPSKRGTRVVESHMAFRKEDATAASHMKNLKKELEESHRGMQEEKKVDLSCMEVKHPMCSSCGRVFTADETSCVECGRERGLGLREALSAQFKESSTAIRARGMTAHAF